MTEDRVREIFHEELAHHALAGGIIDNVVERAVRNYAHDHVTTVSLTPGVAAGRDELRMLLHRLDDALAAFDPAAGADALNALVWRALTPVVGAGRPPLGAIDETRRCTNCYGHGKVMTAGGTWERCPFCNGTGHRGHPPPGDPDA